MQGWIPGNEKCGRSEVLCSRNAGNAWSRSFMQSGFCLIVRGKSEIITKTFAWMIRSSRICRIPILFIHASRDEIAEGRSK